MAAPPLLLLRRMLTICARHTSSRLGQMRALDREFTHATHCSRSSSIGTSTSNSNPHRKQARVRPSVVILAVASLGSATYYLLTPSSKPASLNQSTFVPYTITARDAISPSSALFTVSPHQHQHHGAPPSAAAAAPTAPRWRYPLWSVEFKQPEVQIARYYTPLPPRHDDDDDDDDGGVAPGDGALRFYVRAVPGGEMSGYLNRLRVGDDVYLRGPHPGFDVLRRLGSCEKVVFLAGGTGVVPGMQVASAVLGSNDACHVELLWAVRRRDEVQSVAVTQQQQQQQPWWKSWTTTTRPPALTEITLDLENPSPVARELMHLKARFGDRLHIRLAVDEDRTHFTAKHVQSALLRACRNSSNARGQTRGAVVNGRGCRLHDQLLHVQASEFEDPSAATCQCDGSDGPPGKNLLLVSGPDGFVAHYAGEKMWLGGTLTQGRVGGVAAQLARGNPSLVSDWLVLKL
ncbi:hypothetical protein E4U41_007645 [Claviceps citrina]|nr:hypothetical protein E4U41_007645 [Claviceps citrina]